jgi:hypothetical protein
MFLLTLVLASLTAVLALTLTLLLARLARTAIRHRAPMAASVQLGRLQVRLGVGRPEGECRERGA